MKKSFFEDFLSHLGKSKRKNRNLATIGLALAVVVFIGAYMFVSQNAIAEEVENLDKTEHTSDIVILQANDPYTTGLDTKKLVNVGDITNGELDPDKLELLNLQTVSLNTIEEEPVAPYPLKDDNITTVTVLRYNGSGYVDLTEHQVQDEDKIKITLAYSLADDELKENQNTITYQLPVGIAFDAPRHGDVTVAGEGDVGNYVIDTNGFITIVFEDGFSYTDAFDGTITFEGEIDGDADITNNTIKFGDSCTITLKEEEETTTGYDIRGTKDVVKQDDGTLDYTITVSSTNGTEEAVEISDRLLSGQGKVDGDYSAFHITKNGTEVGVTPNIQNTATPSKFDMTLPQMTAGESYTITYTVTPEDTATNPNTDGSISIGNRVTGVSGEQHFHDSETTTLRSRKVIKTGDFDETTGEITWTVTIEAGTDGLNGYELGDTMTVNGEAYTDFENVQLEKPDATVVTIGSLPYTFNNCPAEGTYTITYTTKLKANQTNHVANTATLEKEGQPSYEDGQTMGESYTTYTLEKACTEEGSASQENPTYSWESTITIPEHTEEINGEMVYEDELIDLWAQGHNTDEKDHFTTIAALKDMVVTVGDGEVVTRGTAYTIWCKDLDETEYSQVQFDALDENSDIKLYTFKLCFTEEFLESHANASIKIQYDSYLDGTATEMDVTYLVRNIAKVGDRNARVEKRFEKAKPFSKLVSTTPNGTYQEGLTDIYYNTILDGNDNAILNYKINVSTKMFQENTILLADDLPDGATLVEDSVEAKFEVHKINGQTHTADQIWLTNGVVEGNKIEAENCVTAQETNGIVTFTILNPNQYVESFKDASFAYADLQFTYKIILPKPETWDGDTEKSFVNSLSYGDDTVENEVTVVDTDSYLSKTGKQESTTGENGEKFTSKAQYSLIVNKSATDLNVEGDTIELVDTLNTRNQYVTATLVRDSVKLYEYVDGAKGAAVPVEKFPYATMENGTKYTITMTVPDKKAFVLEYTYDIYNNTAGNVNLTNEATLEGLSKTEAESKINFVHLDSYADVNQGKATVYKYEVNNEGIFLEGATFRIEQYVGTNWSEVGTVTTDANGEILLSFMGTNAYSQDTLYALIETQAPSGYALDETPRYFVWATKSINTIEKPNDVSTNHITVFSPGSATLMVPNTPMDSIVVKKQWLNANEEKLENPPVDTIAITIYQFVEELPKAIFGEFNLTGEMNWEKEFELVNKNKADCAANELPMYDDAGNRYSYSFVETNRPDGYVDNYPQNFTTGISRGEFIIQNKQIAYTLPETGGLGTALPMVAGLLLITLSTTLMIYRKKRTT